MFRLKEVLKEKKMTANELAMRAGITPVVLSRYINGSSSPRLDLMERLAEILEVDVVELIKAPGDKSQAPAKRKTREQLQHDAYIKMLSYCKYYHGEIGIPLKMKSDSVTNNLHYIECSVCCESDMYLYDTGGNSLRHEFYLRIASRFNKDPKHYYDYMKIYFGDRPKIFEEMLNIFGRLEEVVK